MSRFNLQTIVFYLALYWRLIKKNLPRLQKFVGLILGFLKHRTERRTKHPRRVISEKCPITWPLCLFITSIPIVTLYIGYSIGVYLMPPPRKFPDRDLVVDVGRLNYSWYNTQNITVDFIGGLGNHMFQYASLYGIAKANGLKPIATTENRLLDIFPNLKSKFVLNGEPFQKYSRFNEFNPSSFDGRSFSLNFMKNVRLEGFLQSWRYFDHTRSDIKKQFAFQGYITKSVTEKIGEMFKLYADRLGPENMNKLQGKVQLIGIHVRRGDTLDEYNKEKGYTVADAEYLKTAIKYFEVMYKNTIFVVCTDDEMWSRDNVKTASPSSLVVLSPFTNQRQSPAYDLCLLSMCNHTIITVGTFGWWGAWLAGGDVVYYKAYPKPFSQLARSFSYTDYYPQRWVPL